MKIAFVGRFYWHNGSSHALLGYRRAAEAIGFDVRVSEIGIVDQTVRSLIPIAPADWCPDLLVCVFEERFLREGGFRKIETSVPRDRRIVIDPDGKYTETVTFEGDCNHFNASEAKNWRDDFERISDKILQPSLGKLPTGVSRFLYFGVDLHRVSRVASDKVFDVVYVGNNWYRWAEIMWLFGSLSRIRGRLGRLAIFGQYWGGIPLENYETETFSDPNFFRMNGIETFGPVPFDKVEETMEKGFLSPIFARPILRHLKLVTPRMFETFAAATVPLLPENVIYALPLYDSGAKFLVLGSCPSKTVQEALSNYGEYSRVANDVRESLQINHNYEVRLRELVALVG